ncbi:MAG: DNA polymerase III subunit gamma/tau [Oscillospiraceae bacterium]|nr:DNA polymerase III subunit gamma/tau [Oscillospiraceae bacterium]
MYQALYRKWRPRTFDDVVGQSHITDTLKTQTAGGRLSHAYLFTGTRGTGKTTCAKILARAVNCEHPVNGNPCNQCPACLGIENGSILDVLELDAASNNGVDQVRALRDEAVYSPAAVRRRVYIVDEVHMLSTAAFNALLKILEEPPAHLMFILATTELHKVPATILSRCQRFSFKRILPGDISARLSYVSEQEGIDLTRDGAALLARLADGAMRDALSLLDQCAVSGGRVDQQAVLDALGLAGNLKTAHIMNAIRRHDAPGALAVLSELYAAGKDVSAVLDELASLARDLLIRKTAPQGGISLLGGGYDEGTMRTLAEGFPAERLLHILTLLQAALSNLSRSSNRRTDAELCLLRLCDESLDGSLTALASRVAQLEQAVANGAVCAPPDLGRPAEGAAPPAEEFPPRDGAPPPPSDRDAPPPEGIMGSGGAPALAAQAVPAGFWPELAAALRGRIPMMEYALISNSDLVTGVAADGVLTLYADSGSTRSVLDKPSVLQPLGEAAAARLGGPVRVSVTVGKPPAQAEEKAHDKLDDLLAFGKQFGNITIK